MPTFAPMLVLYWCGALLGGEFWPGLLLYVIGGVLVQIALGRGLAVGRVVAAAVVVGAAVLTALRDIHGAALVAGLAIAVVLAVSDRPARHMTPHRHG